MCAACDAKASKVAANAKRHRIKVEHMNSYIHFAATAPKGESDLRRAWEGRTGISTADDYKNSNTVYKAFQCVGMLSSEIG